MKIFVILTLIFLSSCSSNFIHKKLEEGKRDLFGHESLLRYSSDRLKIITKEQSKSIKGISYCHSGEITKGLQTLKNEFHNKKNSALYWNHIGTCYLLDKKLEKAEYYLHLSLSQNDSHKEKNYLAANNLGILYTTLGHYQEAINQYKLVMKHHPKLKAPLFNMAQVYIKFAKLNEAKSLLKKLLRQNKIDPDVNSSLAILYSLEGEFKKAVKMFTKLPKRFLRRQELSNFYAYSLYKLNKIQPALEILNGQKKGQSFEMNQFRNKLTILLRERRVL